MRNDPENNILHNYQREVILAGIRESESVCRVLQEDTILTEMLRSSFSERNSKTCFDNQLFLIG